MNEIVKEMGIVNAELQEIADEFKEEGLGTDRQVFLIAKALICKAKIKALTDVFMYGIFNSESPYLVDKDENERIV